MRIDIESDKDSSELRSRSERSERLERGLFWVLVGAVGTILFTTSWAIYNAIESGQNLILAKNAGIGLANIRLSGPSGNHVIVVVILGLFGLALLFRKRIVGFMRCLWTIGWHEELWSIMLMLAYLRNISWAWVSPLIFSWAGVFIIATLFWGQVNKKDWLFIPLSGIYFIAWGTFGKAGLSVCLTGASFVTNCSNSIPHNLVEIGSWLWMIGIGIALWL